MKKIISFSLLMLSCVLLSGCWGQKQTTAPATPAPVASTPTTPAKETFNGTLEQLLARGKSVKCQSTDVSDNIKSEGVFYIDAGAGRTMSVIKSTDANGKVTTSNMIMTKESVYIWPEGSKEGIMMPVTKPEATPATGQTNPELDKRNQNFSFDCQAWTLDTSLFTVPTDVKFIDQAKLMNSANIDIEALKAKAQQAVPKK